MVPLLGYRALGLNVGQKQQSRYHLATAVSLCGKTRYANLGLQNLTITIKDKT